VPGQSITLRLSVLVPTWMPEPPELPTFETPNLRVRLPPQSSGPTSRNVNGERWSGVYRRYLLTPMVPGQFTLPPQNVIVTYAQPGGTDPVEATVQTQAITFRGTVPAGAEGLDPFIAANALTLKQELSGPTTGLDPGASVVRTITATIEGTSPIVLPALMPQIDLPAIRVYPATPQVAEDDGSDVLSGTRVESETLMAVGGGEGSAPPVSVDWFNLKTGAVETAQVPGFDISVTGPPPAAMQAARLPDWRLILAGLAAVVALAVLARWLGPRLLRAARTRRSARLASAAHARRKLIATIGRRDYPATAHWMAEWQSRLPAQTETGPLSQAMAGVGRTIYGPQTGEAATPWQALARAVRAVSPPRHGRTAPALPALNPGHAA
jgi:hypothetical protein